MVNGIARYPELIGKFNTYGENQIDFSIRFYSFILDLIHLYETEPNEYIIMLTHNVIVSRIIGLQKIAQDLPNSPINPSEVSGKLYYLEWYAGISVQ
jgi:hypothetical protein